MQRTVDTGEEAHPPAYFVPTQAGVRKAEGELKLFLLVKFKERQLTSDQLSRTLGSGGISLGSYCSLVSRTKYLRIFV